MWERVQGILNEEFVIPLWLAALLVTLNLFLLAGAVLLGYWRGSTLRVRSIRFIACAFLAYPGGLLLIEKWLKVEIDGLTWETALVACFAIGCLAYIESRHISGQAEERFDEDEQRRGHKGMRDIYDGIVDEWVEAVADDGSEHVGFRRTVLYAIVHKQYAGGKVHESPSITWPDDWSYSKKWTLIGSLWSALITHGERQLPAIRNDFQTVAEGLQKIVEDGPPR